MNRYRTRFASICIAIIFAMPFANMSFAGAEEQPLNIAIEGHAVDSFVAVDEHVWMPAGTVNSVYAVNPIDAFLIGKDQERDVRRLFELIAEADVIKDAPNDLIRFASSSYGADLNIQYTPDGAEPLNITLWGAYAKPHVMIVLERMYEPDAEETCITVESEELNRYLLELCRWRTYPRDILTSAQSIGVWVCKEGNYPDYDFVTMIEDAKWINAFVKAILDAEVIGQAYNLPPMIKFEFILEKGDVEYAYMRTNPVASLMQVGGQQVELKEGNEKRIADLLPKSSR